MGGEDYHALDSVLNARAVAAATLKRGLAAYDKFTSCEAVDYDTEDELCRADGILASDGGRTDGVVHPELCRADGIAHSGLCRADGIATGLCRADGIAHSGLCRADGIATGLCRADGIATGICRADGIATDLGRAATVVHPELCRADGILPTGLGAAAVRVAADSSPVATDLGRAVGEVPTKELERAVAGLPPKGLKRAVAGLPAEELERAVAELLDTERDLAGAAPGGWRPSGLTIDLSLLGTGDLPGPKTASPQGQWSKPADLSVEAETALRAARRLPDLVDWIGPKPTFDEVM
jgi:hypothetical protein